MAARPETGTVGLPPDAPCGALAFGDNGVIVDANAQLHAWLGYAPGELVGRSVDTLLSPSGRVFYSTHFFPLLRMQGRADEIQLMLRSAGGEDAPFLISGVRDTTAVPPLIRCALMTMGRRREFEAALLAARKAAEAATQAKDEFLAMVSHELRNPLSAILGWARLARSGRLDAAMMARALETIERNALAQTQLIEDLLDVSRIVSGKLRLSPRLTELSAVVAAALDTARPSAQAKGISLHSALDPAAGAVHADPDRVQQMVWNLVSNAVKFTPKDGRVQVSLTRAGSRVRLEVSDTGAGLSAAQIPYLFDRFWQADPSAQREKTGLGLGLAITRSLVELHGGTLEVSSPGPGEGATFTIEFPLAVSAASGQVGGSARAVLEAPEPSAATVLRGVRVLVVDDDAEARGLLRLLLVASGAQVEVAGSCDDALRRLEAQVPDLLISDIGMPGRDGFELIRQVRAGVVPAATRMPAVAVTGLARPQDRVNLLRAGFQAHLCKPVEPTEVVALAAALAALPKPG
ncbi:ATP-binding protein [Caldimonas brevitalea]|uniref:histidine kinase n=1 Tax=Caldimonas brevitalea TaxID=413882 RepID=A0A0G3BJ27_9BURK|nr:ATP-binding protein [Caldimonas brevitalea]AKJ29372.1 two-component sensor histidine kinase [Caldimonas brevitalea]